ncbi:MAG: calcium/sodium antiporter [bacterium]|nr:calcium/sodium antiporter [bacterium]
MIAWSIALVSFIIGLYLLTKSADLFVDGSVALAHRLRVPPLIIGFTIVGFGTSAPELLVSLLASLQGDSILALGNVYGSNITNILLILGACMVVAPIAIHRTLLKRDIPFLLLITVLVILFCAGGTNAFTRIEGIILLLAFLLFTLWQIFSAMRHKAPLETPQAEESPHPTHHLSFKKAFLYTFGGLFSLIAVSKVLVSSATWIAEALGKIVGLPTTTTELIISVTIIALGTSLPELMASISATRKGQDDIAVGNIIGSNCFNLCMVAGISLIIQPVAAPDLPFDFRYRDLYMMLFTTLLVWIPGLFLWKRFRKHPSSSLLMGRRLGFIFLLLWIIYTLAVVLTTR